MPLAVFEEYGRAKKAYDASVLLASIGYGQPAASLASLVAESSFATLWGIAVGETADHLADLHARYARQLEAEALQVAGLPSSYPTQLHLSAEERAEALDLFGLSADGLWTGHPSTLDLVDEVIAKEDDAFARQQLGRLKLEIAHAHAMRRSTGIAQQSHRRVVELDGGQKALAVNRGPGPEDVSGALHLAMAAFFMVTDEVLRLYAPDLVDESRKAEAFLWRAWKDPALLASLSEDDPCPCDKLDTLWGTCHKWTEALGTVAYSHFTDADLVHFTPFDPKTQRRYSAEDRPPQAPSEYPIGPHFATFTFALPFTLGLDAGPGPTMLLPGTWADPDDAGNFGSTPTVRIRLHNDELPAANLWLGDPSRALQEFYGAITDASTEVELPPIKSYEQWVTLETPGALLDSESAQDPAFAFHRCLSALNYFLATMELAVSALRISMISTHEMGPVVFRGAVTREGKWVRLSDLLMHRDALPFSVPPVSFESVKPQFEAAFNSLTRGRPFIVGNLWHGRAQRALRVRGDTADGVVNLQTAAESLMYDLLRSLMVDEGKTSEEIAAITASDLPFKTLMTQQIPRRLGGNWSTGQNRGRTGVVGRFWADVYLLRNRVVHAGYTPSIVEADQAHMAFLEFRELIGERLWACWPRYPRTLFVKAGVNGLERRGWLTARVKREWTRLQAESYPFFWPKDRAGR